MDQGRIFVVGSANMDLVIGVDAVPRPGETVAGGDLRLIPGGKGANQACAAARMGGRVSMVAEVGRDSFGEMLLESLRSAGVDTAAVGRNERPTGCASIYVLPSGENCIVISPGANGALEPNAAVGRLKELSARDYVLLQLEVPVETVDAVLLRAKRAGATTILDPAPARSLPRELLRNVDYLTPNQTEACTLAGRTGQSVETAEEAGTIAAELIAAGCGSVIVKMGESGCVWCEGSERRQFPAHRVRAVDTTAAGDVFNGAFAAALLRGESVDAALEWANCAAAISVTRYGAQTSIPSAGEVERFRIER